MELHHDKHHAAYVAGANAALEQLEGHARTVHTATSPGSPRTWRSTWWHTNHSIFWNNLSPRGWRQAHRRAGSSNRRVLRLLRQVPRALHQRCTDHSGLRLGNPRMGHRWQAPHHRAALRSAGQHLRRTDPVLQLDMGARILSDYQNVKGDGVKAFWNIVNWADVRASLQARSGVPHQGLVL